MEKSEKVPELKVFPTTNKSENSLRLLNPEVTVNQMFHANQHHDRFTPTCCMGADYFCQRSPRRVGQVNQEFRSQPAHAAQHKELMQHREPEGRGATPARMNLHHQPPDGWCPRPAQTRQSDTRGQSCGTTGPANMDTTRSGKKGVEFGFASRFIWDLRSI